MRLGMPFTILRSEEGELKRKIKTVRQRLRDIVDDKYGPDQFDTDKEERVLQGRLAFLEGELKRLNQPTWGRSKKPKYIQIQSLYSTLRSKGLTAQQAITQIADERNEDGGTVKWAVYYKPKKK
jgi:hypothetical protein